MSHSWSRVKLVRCGLQFFYRYVLKRPWDWTEIVKPPRPQCLPDVLTRQETLRLLGTVRNLRYRVFFTTRYSTGLRLSEGWRWRWATSTRSGCGSLCVGAKATSAQRGWPSDLSLHRQHRDPPNPHAGWGGLPVAVAAPRHAQGLSAQSRLRLSPCQLQSADSAAAPGASIHPAPAEAETAAVLQTVWRNGDRVDLPRLCPSESSGKARSGGPGDGDVTRPPPPPVSGHSRPRGALD